MVNNGRRGLALSLSIGQIVKNLTKSFARAPWAFCTKGDHRKGKSLCILTIDKPSKIWYNIDTKEREVNKMKVYEVYIEGYCTNGDRGVSKYLGQHTGKTFAEAARQACVSRFGEESTKTYFDIRGGIPAFWGCRLYDNYADAACSFG